MADKYNHLIVALEKDAGEEEMGLLIQLIKRIKNVADVKAGPVLDYNIDIAQMTEKNRLITKLYDFLHLMSGWGNNDKWKRIVNILEEKPC